MRQLGGLHLLGTPSADEPPRLATQRLVHQPQPAIVVDGLAGLQTVQQGRDLGFEGEVVGHRGTRAGRSIPTDRRGVG